MILNANALHIPLANETVQCAITSPPYWGLRDYGVSGQLGLEPTPEEYTANMVQVFREVWRVLRNDGVLWLNLGDSYVSQPAGNKTPSGFSQIGGKREGNLGKYNTQNKKYPNLKPKDLVGIPWRVAFALQADGWWLRQDIIWHKPNPMPESVTDRCTKAHEYVFLMSKSGRYFYDAEAVKENAVGGTPGNKTHKGKTAYEDGDERMRTKVGLTSMGAVEKRNKRSVWTVNTRPYKGAHFATFPPKLVEPMVLAGTSAKGQCPACGAPWERWQEKESRYEKRQERGAPSWKGAQVDSTGWQPPLVHNEGWQPTCACDAGEPIPQIVLDPFAGTATVGRVCIKHGRRFVGLELNPDYIELAQQRTSGVQVQML
jgi:DNA modification methylase